MNRKDYKNEKFLLAYAAFEEQIILDSGKGYLDTHTIKIRKDEKIKSYLSKEAFKYKEGNYYYEVTLQTVILIYLLNQLIKVGITVNSIYHYVSEIYELFDTFPVILDIYVFLAKNGENVSFCLGKDIVTIMTDKEQGLFSNENTPQNFIHISLNDILYSLTETKDFAYSSDNSFKEILNKMLDENFYDITIEKTTNGEVKFVKSNKKYSSKDYLHSDLVRKFRNSEITTRVSDGKIQSFTVKEWVKFI